MANPSKTSTSSQADFPARTSQSQEKEQGLKGRGRVFGQKCTASLAKYDQDTHSLKTYQCSLFGGEQELLLILPKSGTIVNGKLSEQTMWEHGTEGNGSGLWPTPQAMDARQDIRMRSELSEKAKKGGCSNLREEVHRRTFPTPRAYEGGAYRDKDGNPKERSGLKSYVKMFPTPTSRDWKDTGENVNWEKVAKKSKLAGRVMLPTPTAAEADKIPAKANYGQIGLNNHPLLRGYPTRPKATKSRKGEKMVFPTPRANLLPGLITKTSATRNKGNLEEVVAEKENLTSGQLNPTWVEWLMGYPTGWTDLKDSETP